MSYSLKLIHQVVEGNLSPLYFPPDATTQANWYQYLSQAPDHATKQIHARFEVSDAEEASIAALQMRLLDRFHPPVFLEEGHQVQQYEQIAGEVLLNLVLQKLSIAAEAVTEWYHWQDEKGQVHLELYADYPLKALSFEEKRYHFFQRLMLEQVAQTRQVMLDNLHETSSTKAAQKYAQDHQRALLNYAHQILAKLEDIGAQVYPFSGEYILPDVFRHIFLDIEELLHFVEQKFASYLDKETYFPYRDLLITSAQLTEQLKAFKASLKISAVSEDLRSVLDEAFQKLEKQKSEPISYLQMRYAKQLLDALEALVQEGELTNFKLASTLYQHNLNSPVFISFLMRCLDERVAEKTSVHDKLEVLYHYRKLSRQLSPRKQPAYLNQMPAVDEPIQQYIEEDIWRFQQRMQPEPGKSTSLALEEDDENASAEDTKIPTSLSVKQWAYLIRLFFDVKIFPEGKKAAVYRLFNQAISTAYKKDLSEGSLYNRQYEIDLRTREVVQDKLQAMINLIRNDSTR